MGQVRCSDAERFVFSFVVPCIVFVLMQESHQLALPVMAEFAFVVFQ